MSVLRQNRKARKDQWAILIIALLVISLFGFGGYVWYEQTTRINFDERGCPDTGVQAKTVFLIDTSDGLSTLQRLDMKKRIDALIAQAPQYAQVVIYSLVPEENTHARKVFDRCKPRDGTEANALNENERFLKQAWREEFAEPVGLIVNNALESQTADRSPLMEALQYIAVQEMGVSAAQPVMELIIASDMLQHTAQYSHYRDGQNYTSFEQLPYSSRVSLSMPSVSVHVLYIMRPDLERLQLRKHTLFWEQYFLNAGAMIQSVSVLPAGA